MWALKLNRNCIVVRLGANRGISNAPAQESEYTSTPLYPPILDLSYDKVKERKELQVDEEIKAVKTVEEKQIKINMPRYYGFKSYMFTEDSIPYNNLTLAQYVTRTHLIKSATLPDFYKGTDLSETINAIKPEIEAAILFELDGYQRLCDLRNEKLDESETDNIIGATISKQINRVLTNHMSRKYPHLADTHVDFGSRIESAWSVGGMNPPEIIRKSKRGNWMKDRVDEPTDRVCHYIGTANLALRSDKPLLPIIPHSEAENPEFSVPKFEFDPRVVGISTLHRHHANVPGFWPGEAKEFGLLSYHRRGHFLNRTYNDPEDNNEALYRQGIMASFGWLNAQANFLGFTSVNDVTYPLVTQTVITNGQNWSFFVYQLNTLINHSIYAHENPKKNICWALQDQKLYEGVENGKLVGFNDDTLALLVKLYANVPEPRLGTNLKPYLSTTERVSADYEDNEKAEWLEREYKFLVSNRPRAKLPYEIYHWEKIYKIDHNTRFIEAKRRPFELKINPYKRTLDDRQARYIPRAHRPHLKRWQGRYAPEFFP